MKYVPKLIQIKYSNFGNFAHPTWPAPPRFTPCKFSLPRKSVVAKMEQDFSLAPRGGAEMGLDFLDPHPTPPHPTPSRTVPILPW